MVTVLVIMKALLEIAALALLGQGLLYVLAGAKRDTNVFYRVLSILTRPILKSARFIAPRFIVDQHIGALALLSLIIFWYVLLINIHNRCLNDLGNPSCSKLAAEYIKRCEAGNGMACQTLERNGIHATQ